MIRINILDRQTAQLIAAGEITENPASVVKELLENSIDAGSTRIVIEIENGGKKLIKISDNGHGIYREDVEIAFARHATSKLKTSNDINKVSSLGFRGEALASICSVSKIELLTKSSGEVWGTKISIEGGSFGSISDAGCSVGSSITVRDLFYNTPARMKFLKKDIVEGNKISSIVDKIALSHPEILFKFIRDGKESLCTVGDGKASSAIYSVYGKDFFDGMLSIDTFSSGGMTLKGYVSTPEKCRPSKYMQMFFVNGRLVKEKLVSAALEEAFRGTILPGKNPCCVIYLNIPYELVDVNVHPSKSEVRFVNESEVFEIICCAVKKALIDFNLRTSIIHSDSSKQKMLETNLKFPVQNAFPNFEVKSSDVSKNMFQNFTFSDFASSASDCSLDLKPKILEISKPLELDRSSNQKSEEKGILNSTEIKHSKLSFEVKSDLKKEVNCTENIKFIGEVFRCYFIIQYGENLIVMDKHAAHERVIFEKMRCKTCKLDSQVLLRPISITLEKQEYAAVMDNLELFSAAGYEIEEFGPSNIIVRSAPMYEDFDKLESAVIEIANYILNNKMTSKTKKLEWIYHSISCRSAIKAGNSTSFKEIYTLIKEILRNPDFKFCPHGRPIYIEFDKKLIEKRFGRT